MARRLRFLLLLLPLVLVLSASLDTPFHALWRGSLTGVLKSAARPTLSFERFWASQFQAGFEAWFEQELACKAALVRSDNSLNLALFDEISAHTRVPIVLGKRHTLFERNYIDNYNDVSDAKGDPPVKGVYSVAESARSMGRAARAFRLLGVDFMVVFYPGKAATWSDRLPARYVLPGGSQRSAAGYRKLLTALAAQGVTVIDGSAVFQKIARENPQYKLYNSGGTHWTNAGACQVARRIVEAMPLANPRGARLQCRVGRARPANDTDIDLANLINVWDNSRFVDSIPAMSPALSAPLTGGARDALVVGTSFSAHLIRQLHASGVLRNVQRLVYYRHENVDNTDWKKMASRRVVIFEQFQWSYFTVNLSEFLDDFSTHSAPFAAALARVDSESGDRLP